MIREVPERNILWKVLCVCTLVLLLMPALASSEEIYKFERMWPTLQQPWYFGHVTDIGVDSQGNIFVINGDMATITKFNRDGQFITKWGTEGVGDGQFAAPAGVAVDGNDYLYVTERNNHRVQKFTAAGQFVTKWGSYGSNEGQFKYPGRLSVDGGGNVYVIDRSNYRIQKFTTDGHFVTKWGSQGLGDSQLGDASGIATDRIGNVYVSEPGNNRIKKFTSNGQFLAKWGSQGSGDGQFFQPMDIEVDEKDNVYVVDYLNDRLQKFTADGRFLMKWGGEGAADGQVTQPTGITVDRRGAVYVADSYNHRIQKFTADGLFLTKWGSTGQEDGHFGYPMNIEVDADGYVYVVDHFNHRIQKFSPDGQFVTTWGSNGSANGQFYYPTEIAQGTDGYLYVLDRGNGRIQKFTTDGKFVSKWGTVGLGDGQFNSAERMAVDRNGYVYVADWTHRIQKFTSDGQFVRKWGGQGSGDGQFNLPTGIAVDGNGYVYVADRLNHRIQKFTSDGRFVMKWGSAGAENGKFLFPEDVTIDKDGYVYVTEDPENGNHRIQKFTPNGQFVTKWGQLGSLAGQFASPSYLAFSPNGLMYVVDTLNDRIQSFRKVETSGRNKAIIVAGGGAYPGNDLWDATQMAANFAYRTLTYQGFTKESIHYLSSANIDFDDNGILDDVAANATNANLQNAILNWATGADDVILYLVDHGGEGSFRMSGTETLSASELASWLDALQNTITGKVIVIYDACGSGSFVDPLKAPAGKQRIVITSTSPGEKAYFLTQGSVSYSNYFWTHVFNGVNLSDAFNLAKEAITYTTPYQHPLLDANGNGIANEAEDLSLVQNMYIGNGTVIYGSAPVITEITSEQTISNTSAALLYASGITDTDGIARVWAVIRPPDYRQGSSASPVQDLPSIDLMPVSNSRYEATYAAFTSPGTYQVAIYARDRIGNTSIPKVTQVSVVNPLRRKAIIVAAGSQSGPLWPAVERNTGLAYGALKFQGYGDEDIYFMSPVTFSSGVDVAPTVSNLRNGITVWAATNTQDLVLYLIGSGGNGTVKISPTETLSSTDLKQWLDTLQENIPGKVVVIYDGPQSGSFLPALTPLSGKQRILISSTGSDQPAHFLSRGDLSFSRFFWSRVSNGMNLRDAYLHGKRALSFLSSNQVPFLDDNGNGIGNEKADGQVAMSYTIGFGIGLGADDPLIGSVSPPQTLTGQSSVILWAKDVTTTGRIVKVWAVIAPPGTSQNPDTPVTDLPTLDLICNQATNQYEATYYHLNTQGQYTIAVYARDAEGNISLPATTTVTQTVALDPYEDDNTPNRASVIVLNDSLPQKHAFDVSGDEDWLKFYALAGETYEVKTENLGARSDTVLTVYGPDSVTVLKTVDDGGAGEGEILSWQCETEGVYYVRVKHYDPSVFGEGTGYDLRIYVPAGPPLVAFIKGKVTDGDSGEAMAGVKIKTDAKISALSLSDGNYLMMHPAGTFTMTAEAGGYETFIGTLSIAEAGTINRNISMNLISLKGDINHDRRVDLVDALLALRVMSKGDTQGLIRSDYGAAGVDANGDGKIALHEAIYILQKVAGLR